jgi:diguanylate cyclase (GGDEF)-like protein
MREYQYQDELTGLYNQKHLDRILEQELRRGERLQTKFAVVFLDLDNFKHINDNHGHLAGSSILKQFGDLLRDTLRDVDSIIRYGGDEYVVILLGADSYTAWQVSERIRSTVAAHVFIADGTSLRLTCSMGIACYPEDGMTKESLLKAADQQMYFSKEKGKNLISARGKQPQISGLDESWMMQRIKQRRKT